MEQTLYLKYRPKFLNEVVGQELAVKILRNSIEQKKFSHSYIFYGPRGTGKTSAARIFAKTINCLNVKDGERCGECESCLKAETSMDIIEIDGATNNKVDEIRELNEATNFVPSDLKYKVYIIDEFHMITKSGFNAFLKTMEEPPEHVIFILATTELEKVPDTIISRGTLIEFNRISVDAIVERLSFICEQEQVEYEQKALKMLAKLSNGGMRDSISMLQKAIIYVGNNKITTDVVSHIIGVSSSETVELFVKLYKERSANIVGLVSKLEKEGIDTIKFIESVMLWLSKNIDYANSGIILEMNEAIEILKNSTYAYIVFKAFLINKLMLNKSVVSDNIEPNMPKIEMKNNSQDIQIIVDKIMADANKSEKNKVVKEFKSLVKYQTDIDYGYLSGEMSKCDIGAVSKDALILYSRFESTVENINNKVEKFAEFTKLKLNVDKKIVAISEEKWKLTVQDYIKDLRNKKKETIIAKDVDKFNKLFKNIEKMEE